MKKLLLASKSPRRRELLKMLDFPFEIVSLGDLKEEYPENLEPEEVPGYLSKLKSKHYRNKIKDDEILVTADTVVILENEILGKPHSHEEACAMLRKLSGRVHHVVTGVTLADNEKSVTFKVVTDVEFSSLTDAQIRFYVDNFKPYDKAGAYGIQEWIGAVGISGISGSFYNVMGLPLHRLHRELLAFQAPS